LGEIYVGLKKGKTIWGKM